MFRPGTARRRRRRVAIGTGDKAPEFDLEEEQGRPRVRLADYLGRSNVLLVFHPFAYTSVCTEEALDLQENLASFRNANTEIVFVSCDSAAARQAWKRQLGAEYTFASDFWSHGAAARQYGVFNEENGAPIRGTFLIDKDGIVIWSLVKDTSTQRTEMVPESLDTLRTKA
jgi:peroxiredoxin